MLAHVSKRFYRQATARSDTQGFNVWLDEKQLKTPAGRPLVLPALSLAEAVADEWNAQADSVCPDSMPLMQLVSTAVDRVDPMREAIIAEMLSYGETDLLCYRATDPSDLVEQQTRLWQPLLDWAAQTLGVDLHATAGILAIPQPPASLLAARDRLGHYDMWTLTAAQSLCAACGSLILALAVVEGHIDSPRAWELALLDELHQSAHWGEDAEATARRTTLRGDLLAAERLLTTLSYRGKDPNHSRP